MKKAVIIMFVACAALTGRAVNVRAEEPAPVAGAELLQEAPAPAAEALPPQEAALPEPAAPVPRRMRISERLGRSVANIVTSPLELPAQMYVRARYQEDRTDNPFAVIGGFVEGIPMGALVYFPWRLYAGLVDLCTLWAPECDKALIYPEYISFSPDFLDKTRMPLDKNPKTVKEN